MNYAVNGFDNWEVEGDPWRAIEIQKHSEFFRRVCNVLKDNFDISANQISQDAIADRVYNAVVLEGNGEGWPIEFTLSMPHVANEVDPHPKINQIINLHRDYKVQLHNLLNGVSSPYVRFADAVLMIFFDKVLQRQRRDPALEEKTQEI